jgi:hypothetical protein
MIGVKVPRVAGTGGPIPIHGHCHASESRRSPRAVRGPGLGRQQDTVRAVVTGVADSEAQNSIFLSAAQVTHIDWQADAVWHIASSFMAFPSAQVTYEPCSAPIARPRAALQATAGCGRVSNWRGRSEQDLCSFRHENGPRKPVRAVAVADCGKHNSILFAAI